MLLKGLANTIKIVLILCQFLLDDFSGLYIMEVVTSNPREVDSLSQLQKFVSKNGELLKVVGHETILIWCLAFVVVDEKQNSILHPILQRGIDRQFPLDVIPRLYKHWYGFSSRCAVFAQGIILLAVTSKTKDGPLLPVDCHSSSLRFECEHLSSQKAHLDDYYILYSKSIKCIKIQFESTYFYHSCMVEVLEFKLFNLDMTIRVQLSYLYTDGRYQQLTPEWFHQTVGKTYQYQLSYELL